MKNAFWGYWLILLGVFIVVIMLLVQSLTSGNTQDYYLVKEITEASMVDAVDYAYYRNYGEIKINKEKFYESFIRRFAETASLSQTYEISFYGVYEAPPKVSVEVKSSSGSFNVVGDATRFDIVNRIDSILEGNTIDESNASEKKEIEVGTLTHVDASEVSGANTSNSNSGVVLQEFSSSTSSNATGSQIPQQDQNNQPEATETACREGITNTWLAGMEGTSLVATNAAKIYTDHARTGELGIAEQGKIFTILGSDNGDWWAIEYDGQCGWIKNKYMAINLKDFIPSGEFLIEYNITNASSSIYKSGGLSIPNVTGVPLYTTEFNEFVPLAYPFAEKIRGVTQDFTNEGWTLVIYDAYRPKGVTEYIYDKFGAFLKDMGNDWVKTHIENGYTQSYFLANNLSAHNYACAVDVSLKDSNGNFFAMPSAMHELSVASAKYTTYNSGNFTNAMINSFGAKTLHKYMKERGINELVSEWWHYQDTTLYNSFKEETGMNSKNALKNYKKTDKSVPRFWSNVG